MLRRITPSSAIVVLITKPELIGCSRHKVSFVALFLSSSYEAAAAGGVPKPKEPPERREGMAHQRPCQTIFKFRDEEKDEEVEYSFPAYHKIKK